MTEYTASNGLKVATDIRNAVSVQWGSPRTGGWTSHGPDETDALREFFQHEHDEELGRWRWPENPDFVVYAEDDGVHNVVNEKTGLSLMATRGGVKRHDDQHADAARAYFDAHPERKPWHEAQLDELWAVTIRGVQHIAKVVSPREGISPDGAEAAFLALDVDTPDWVYRESPWITEGHRVWPEDAS